MIYQGSLTVSAYFGLFADLGTMWRDASKDHIFPGIMLVERIGTTAERPEEMKRRVRELEDWSDNAQSGIWERCKAVSHSSHISILLAISVIADTFRHAETRRCFERDE
jgi:hypothetical protein